MREGLVREDDGFGEVGVVDGMWVWVWGGVFGCEEVGMGLGKYASVG